MELSCYIEGCPGSPKFGTLEDPGKVFCIEHRNTRFTEILFRGSLPLEKHQKSSLAIREMGKLSGMVSEVMKTGKGMFQEICEKLCTITDELARRQQDLLDIAQNVTNEGSAEEISRLGAVGIKLRNREDFAKLVDQHFSHHDATVDFSLFSEDINGIRQQIEESNSLIGIVREEAAKDRQLREEIIKRIDNNEKETQDLKLEITEKIIQMKESTLKREKQLAQKTDIDSIKDAISHIETQVNSNDELLSQLSERCEYINFGVQSQTAQVAGLEAANKSHFEILAKTFEEFSKKIQMKTANLNAAHLQLMAEQEQVREAAFKRANENLNFTSKAMSERYLYKIDELKKNIDEDVKKAIFKAQKKISEFEVDFTNRIRREIDEYKEFKKMEAVRIENERLKQIEEEKMRIIQEEEMKRQNEIQEAEEQRQAKIRMEQALIIGKKKLEKFNYWNINQKKKYFATLELEDYENYSGDHSNDVKEIRISKDGKYGFICNF